MNLWHRVHAKLAQMVAARVVGPADPTEALGWLDELAGKVVAIHQSRVALVADREVMRAALTGLAFEYGLRSDEQGHAKLEDMVLLTWPPDPEPAAEKPKVIAPEKPKLVSLH